jgi:hypothetical protein
MKVYLWEPSREIVGCVCGDSTEAENKSNTILAINPFEMLMEML